MVLPDSRFLTWALFTPPGGGYEIVAGDMNVSTPARRDFQPVGLKMKMKFRE